MAWNVVPRELVEVFNSSLECHSGFLEWISESTFTAFRLGREAEITANDRCEGLELTMEGCLKKTW